MANQRICSVVGCGKSHLASGYCSKHYSRVRRRGSIAIPDGMAAKGAARAFLSEAINYHGDECLIWPFSRNAGGYGLINLGYRSTLVSRVICTKRYGVPPSRKHGALHRCGRGADGCVNPQHLYWGTQFDNMADRDLHGTSNRGVRQWKAKLTETEVLEIRALKGELTQEAIGQRYGISGKAVNAI